MPFLHGLDLGLMTATGGPPPLPANGASRRSRVVHTNHVPGAAVVFVDESGEPDAWAAQVEAVTEAGFCAVLLLRAVERSDDRSIAQACADDLAGLLERLEHDSTTIVGRGHAAAGVVRFLAYHLEAHVDRAILVGLVVPAPADAESGDAGVDDLVAQLRQIHIPVFVARGSDDSVSVDDFVTEMRSWLPERCTVRTYARPRALLTHRQNDEFLQDLLDFIEDSAPVRTPRVDLSPTTPSRTEGTHDGD